jgi:uncharacterized membrane protein YheB (UPF0754 family)
VISTAAQAAITVLFGAVAGGVTNTVAIWMLFHPYEPPRFFRWKLRGLQGAVPKNRDRLARVVGRTVGDRLLTGDDLAAAVAEPTFRRTFDEQLDRFLAEVLDRERGPLVELLPVEAVPQVRHLLDEAGRTVLDRLDHYLESDDFHDAALAWADRLAQDVRDRPVAELLTAEREQALADTAERWIADAVGGEGFERAVHDYLDRAAKRLLEPQRTFEDLLPVGLVAALEHAIAGYLPIALERLGRLLEDPDARARLEKLLHQLLDRFLQDLNFYKRVVAALIIPPDTVSRVMHTLESEGAARLSELLSDDAVRDAMARSVNGAIVDFLERPVRDVLGQPGDPSVIEAKDTVAGWVLGVARDRNTGEFLVDKLHATLGSAENRTWGDLFRRLPPESIAEAVVRIARSDEARTVYGEALERVTRLILERRIGRPADLLGENAADRVRQAIADPLWRWLQEQVPKVAQRVDIAGKVEQKIRDFPMTQLEQIIRGITQRELRLIVVLGYLLGAIIGSGLVAANLLFGL